MCLSVQLKMCFRDSYFGLTLNYQRLNYALTRQGGLVLEVLYYGKMTHDVDHKASMGHSHIDLSGIQMSARGHIVSLRYQSFSQAHRPFASETTPLLCEKCFSSRIQIVVLYSSVEKQKQDGGPSNTHRSVYPMRIPW